MAERAGLSPDVVRDTLMSSVLASPFLGYKAPQLFERQYAPLFSAQLMLKDMDLVLEFARQLGVSLAAAGTIRDQYARAVAAGHGAQDFASVREVVGTSAPADS
jgi:3-hydroxyisobutyrate dehydrogenase-like beta-hydroxyacid dehydrogenase